MGITIETSAVQRRFGKLSDLIGNKTKDLIEDVAGVVQVGLEDNFSTQGGYLGRWKPLKQSTIKDKNRKGFGSRKMLVRTGRLENSFDTRNVKAESAEVGSYGVDYAEYHNDGTRNMPQRKIVGITDKAKRDTVGLIVKYLRRAMS